MRARALPLVVVGALAACSGGQEHAPAPPRETASATAGSAPPAASPPAPAAPFEAAPTPAGPCPDDMVYVDATYCPRVEQACLRDEYNKPNHLTICNRFSPARRCLDEPREQQFCIDRYEHPSRAGGHPPVMVDAYDAEAACEAGGKRLCWDSEWVAACEGPEHLPFPYGLSRDATKCNIDNPYIRPSLEAIYSKHAEIAGPELLRLDQSVPSGQKEGCVSGYGVHDLTGNFDEWVLAEHPKGKSQWAALKGGAWGHVRNACRPMTTSHPPEFTYYFISFRCCKDPRREPGAPVDPAVWSPPPPPKKKDPKGAPSPGWTPPAR